MEGLGCGSSEWKNTLRNFGVPPLLSLPLTVAFWRWIEDPNKPCEPYITVARSNFKRKSSVEQQIEESWEVSIHFFFQLFFSSPLHTHLCWYDVHPRACLKKVIRHVRSYIKVSSGNNDCVCVCAYTYPDVCMCLYLILCMIKISISLYVKLQSWVYLSMVTTLSGCKRIINLLLLLVAWCYDQNHSPAF